MNSLNDTTLIERVLGGDAEAFAMLVGRYSERVFALVRRIAPSREEAEELTQDTFVKAYENLGKFRRESSFSTWLYRIAYNTALSHTRRHRPRPGEWRDEWDAAEGVFEEEAGAGPEESLRRVERALKALPPDDRALVQLFYLEEKPVREVALITGLSENNVKTRLHRIRKRLALKIERKA